MATLLLIIIYLAFISLGLPDSLLGTAWPVMHLEFGVSLDKAGLVYPTITVGTIISSFLSGKVVARFGVGKVTMVSTLMTAIAIFGFYLSPGFIWLFIFAIPLGLGAGSVDAALNNYVALHYRAAHMSWLHCFWGVGATASPIIMGEMITKFDSWRSGYFIVGILQFSLAIILLVSLPLWKKVAKNDKKVALEETPKKKEAKSPLKIKGVKYALGTFFFYCGVEAMVGLWGSSYLVEIKDIQPGLAATWISLYYGGITLGRFLSGFVTFKLSNKMMIRLGQIISGTGVALLLLPLPASVSLVGLILIGLGFAPIFPSMIHETPTSFGAKNSQSIIGYQIAFAYIGTTLLPPIFGFMASIITIGLFPIVAVVIILAMMTCTERMNVLLSK